MSIFIDYRTWPTEELEERLKFYAPRCLPSSSSHLAREAALIQTRAIQDEIQQRTSMVNNEEIEIQRFCNG